MTPIVLTLTPELAGHVAVALGFHRRWLAGRGWALPAGFDELAAAMQDAASTGQARTNIANIVDLDQVGAVPLALNYDDTGRLLGCSSRQVRRLVTDGRLPFIQLGGLVRIRRTDIDAFLEQGGTKEKAA